MRPSALLALLAVCLATTALAQPAPPPLPADTPTERPAPPVAPTPPAAAPAPPAAAPARPAVAPTPPAVAPAQPAASPAPALLPAANPLPPAATSAPPWEKKPAPADAPYVFRPRARLSVEVQTGAAFPFRSFIDYKSSSATLRVDTPVGFNLGINILLNHFELRWSATWLYPCAGCFNISSPQLDSVADALRTVTGGAVNLNTRPQNVEGALVLHQLTGGYRWYLTDGRIRPYIPLSGGLAIATSPQLFVSRPLFGVTVFTGAGVDFELHDHFILGLGVRLNFLITEPERNFAVVDVITNGGKGLYDQPVAYTFFLSAGLQLRGRF